MKQEKLEQVTENMIMTLDLLNAIKAGEVDLEKLHVDGNGWTYEKDK